MPEVYCYCSPIGYFKIIIENNYLTELSFSKKFTDDFPRKGLILEVEKQLAEYFNGRRRKFELPLKLAGTDFQKMVWRELLKIPFGKTISYGELAKRINKPKAARAVGGACNKNKIAIIVPCHRVVGKNGSLVGYAAGVKKKKKLLESEMQINRPSVDKIEYNL